MEQLQSLTIPLSLTQRYLGIVIRFESLETVEFLFDIVYSFINEDIGGAARARKATEWQFEVRFAQDHTRLFKGVLKVVTYGDFSVWLSTHYRSVCDHEVYMEILKPLPPARITSLTDSTWDQYISHPLKSDLSRIDDIHFHYSDNR